MSRADWDDGRCWPDLKVSAWADTKRHLHLIAQMLGKIRLSLSPPQPNWLHTPLYLTPRGLTTGTLPVDRDSLEVRIDIFSSELHVEKSSGETLAIPLLPARTIAHIFRDLQAALHRLAPACTISPVPQEVRHTTPFDADDRPGVYDPRAVARWFAAATATTGIFDRWRSHFFGRSGVQVWWGVLDVAVMLFNGKKVDPPLDRGYLMRYDLDAELMNAGLYLGDEETEPFFYGYIFPEPPGAPLLEMGLPAASWSTDLHEWILPYDEVRKATDPARHIRAFLDAIYGHCVREAGWDETALTYIPPPR